MKLKLAILCSDGPHHVFLVRTLRSHFDVVSVIQEPGNVQRRNLARKCRWNDYCWWTYHALRRRLLGLDAYRFSYFVDSAGDIRLNGIDRLLVDDINGGRAGDLLRHDGHNLTVVMGTSVLKSDMLDAAGRPILNIHGGYLPFYRGNHCFFFALYGARTDRVGSTIHLVNEGVDTGDIIRRILVEVHPNEHPEELYCRAERGAVLELVTVLKNVEEGQQLQGIKQPGVGKMYRMRDRKPWHDVRMWLRRRQPRFSPWLFKDPKATRPRAQVYPS